MVKFIDDNGVEFFECHPAEARTAIEIIQDIRDKNPVLSPEAKKVLKLVPKLISGKRTIVESSDYRSAHRIADCFSTIEVHGERVAVVLCDARAYAEIRKWDRDSIEIESRATYLEGGIMAYLWGAMVVIDRKAPKDVFVVSSEDGEHVAETALVREKPPIVEILSKMQKLLSEAIMGIR